MGKKLERGGGGGKKGWRVGWVEDVSHRLGVGVCVWRHGGGGSAAGKLTERERAELACVCVRVCVRLSVREIVHVCMQLCVGVPAPH